MDKLVFSLYVMVIGLVIVFVVLVILILLSSLTKYANLIPSREDIKKRAKAKKQAKKEAAKALEEAKPAPVNAQETVKPVCAEADMDESELQAVIAAAIAAYLADSSAPVSPNGIVVRSVRRTSALNTASRYERMNNRI